MFSYVRQTIKEHLVDHQLPSLAVAVARDSQILWEEGFGWADREERTPSEAHTMYSLASISKPITATGIMRLVESGQLDLDAPVNEYLGDAKVRACIGEAEHATVRRVANHSAGLPLHCHFFYEDEAYPRPPMDETICRYGNIVWAPGERYEYSNLGYGILDYLIERISGRSYVDFMRQEVFLPLGLTRTSVHVGPGLEAYSAARYGGDGLSIAFYDFDHPGASAVFSSAHDLIRFGLFHLKAHLSDQKAILSDESIDAMQQPTIPIDSGSGYGIGWRIFDDRRGYRCVNHSGGMGGVSTLLTLLPTEGIAVAVLVNASSSLPGLVTEEVLSALLPEYAANRKQEEEQRTRQEPEPERPPFQPSGELLGRWSGVAHTHCGEISVQMWFQEDGDVHVRLGDQLETLLNEVRFEEERLTGKFVGNIGTADANRRPYHLHLALRLRGDVLNGRITSISLPGRRLGNALSHWIEMGKH